MSKLILGTCATQRYKYALPAFGRRVFASIYESNIKEGHIIFVGDQSDEIQNSYTSYIESLLPEGWTSEIIKLDLDDSGLNNYKEDAQFLIAKMQSRLFQRARQLGADYFLSLESDVLIAPNSIRVCIDSLKYDNGYYDVCMCTYPSQGGGSFLGGFGTYRNPIAEDHLISEREIPEKVLQKYNKLQERVRNLKKEDKKLLEQWGKISEEVKSYPPKDNIFTLNGKNWRRRGWMEYTYPGIGKGALLPTDWVGLGCTMISSRALALAHFDGYQGKGTQDLYVGWNFWTPNDIKMCVSTHSICDHIIRDRDGDNQSFDKFTHVRAFHEPEGEYRGHLRQEHLPFHNHV